VLLLALHLHAHWQASWGLGPYCAILSKMLELELMLLLAFLTPPYQPVARDLDAPAKACS